MKFTKQQANEELVKLLTAKGEELNLSARSIDEDLETLIPVLVNEETELNDFVTKVFPIFNTANKNVRTNVSEGIRAYKEKNPVKPQQTQANNKTDTEMEERLKKLEAAYQQAQEDIRIKDTLSSLKKTIKGKGVDNDAWLDAMLSKISVGEDFNVETEATSYVDLYNKMMASYKPNATPDSSNSGVDTHISDAIKEAGELAKAQSLLV